MDWTLLGISPTNDKAAITAAYRDRLRSVHPEEHPDAFMALRAAYEEALTLADVPVDGVSVDDSPLGQWTAQLRALYDDFPARIDPSQWEALLQSDVCVAIDMRAQAEEALLKFLMENFFLPQNVWQVLDAAFSWSSKYRELYETYPRNFVDYAVLEGIRLPDNLPYHLFTPGRNGQACDDFRRLYFRASNLSGQELADHLAQMDTLPEQHPYGEFLHCRLLFDQGKETEAAEKLHRLAEQFPDDPLLNVSWLAECMRQKDWAQAEQLARHILDLPHHSYRRQANLALADALTELGQHDAAKDIIFDLMHEAGGDQKELHHLNEKIHAINDMLIAQWEAQLQEYPDDAETRRQLGWCYLQNEQPEKAAQILAQLHPEAHTPYDYHLFASKVAYAADDWQKTLEEMQILEQLLRALPADCEGDDKKHLQRLPEFLQTQGGCLMMLGRREEAVEKFEQANTLSPDDAELLTRIAHLYFSLNNYQRALSLLEHLTEVLPNGYHGYYLMAQTLYEMRRDQEAFYAINRALELERGDLGVYVLKMRILLRNGVWEEVHKILDFLKENQITDELSVLWCYAQLTEHEEKNGESALEQYQAIARRMEQGEELSWGSQVYMRIALLLKRDVAVAEDRAELIALLDKGLALDKEDLDCLDYKAWILKQGGETEAALELYHQLETYPHNLSVERNLAELYYKNLSKNAAKSLHYYEVLLQHEESDVNLFYAGTCCRFLMDWTKGEQFFLRMQELFPADIDGYGGLGLIYEASGRYEDALTQIDRLISILEERGEGQFERYYMRKVRHLRRLQRPFQAISALEELSQKHGWKWDHSLAFAIYFQFGLWQEAAAEIKRWNRSQRKASGCLRAEITLLLFTGEVEKARKLMKKSGKHLNNRDQQDLQVYFCDWDGDYASEIPIWTARAEQQKENTHALMNLSQQFWWSGDKLLSRRYAQQTLEKLDRILADHPRLETLYRGRRSFVLAVLGHDAEARAELARVRSMPLCEECAYGSCKDADAFEGFMEEVLGNFERAAEIYRAGIEKWPDEMDFIAGLRRVQRKGV